METLVTKKRLRELDSESAKKREEIETLQDRKQGHEKNSYT